MHHRARTLLPALLAGAAAVSIGCATGCINEAPGDPQGPAEMQPVRFEPLPDAQAVRFYSGMTTRQRLVIRDAATWANVWQQLASPFQPVPPVPAVDFATSLVVVAAMGQKNTGGYAITVDDVRATAGEVSISVTEQAPGSGCSVIQALTAPVAVVVVTPRFAGPATFVERAVQHDCQ